MSNHGMTKSRELTQMTVEKYKEMVDDYTTAVTAKTAPDYKVDPKLHLAWLVQKDDDRLDIARIKTLKLMEYTNHAGGVSVGYETVLKPKATTQEMAHNDLWAAMDRIHTQSQIVDDAVRKTYTPEVMEEARQNLLKAVSLTSDPLALFLLTKTLKNATNPLLRPTLLMAVAQDMFRE